MASASTSPSNDSVASASTSMEGHPNPGLLVEASRHFQSNDFDLFSESFFLPDSPLLNAYINFSSDYYPAAIGEAGLTDPSLNSTLVFSEDDQLAISGTFVSPPPDHNVDSPTPQPPTISTPLIAKSSEKPSSGRGSKFYACKDFYKLAECNAKFRNRKALGDHMRDNHDFKAYPCPNDGCTHSSARSDNLGSHIRNCKSGKVVKKRAIQTDSSPDSQPSKRRRRNIRDLQNETPAPTPQSQSTETSSFSHTCEPEPRVSGLATPPSSQDIPKSPMDCDTTPQDLNEDSDSPIVNEVSAQNIIELKMKIKIMEVKTAKLKAMLRRTTEERDDATYKSETWKRRAVWAEADLRDQKKHVLQLKRRLNCTK